MINEVSNLINMYGLNAVRNALIAMELAGQPRGEDLVCIRDPDLFVHRSGRFYRPLGGDGFVPVPDNDLRVTDNGKVYIEMDDFKYWLHHLVYTHFQEPYDVGTYVVTYRDGDPRNCHVDNLLLVRRSTGQ